MGAIRLLAIFGVLAALWPQFAFADDTLSTRTIIQGLPPPAAEPPPLCSDREHLGRPTFLVDQAWQIYRRMEQSSPQRVGWCSCAKRCEPIDKLAADYEEVAFQAGDASRNLSLPAEERKRYADLSGEMFGRRNAAVADFRGCLDATRPPLSPRITAADPLPANCEFVELSLKQRWKLWCDEFENEWTPIATEFRKEFKGKKAGSYWLQVPLKANRNGKISVNGREGWQGVPKDRRVYYLGKLAAIRANSFPEGSQLATWTWGTSMQVINGGEEFSWHEPMPCPEN
jgi:hypothetical protein